MTYDVEKAKEFEAKFLRELDAFCNEWIETYANHNLPIGQVGGLIHSYGKGEIEDIPGPLTLRFCPQCKQWPADMDENYFDEAYTENNSEYQTKIMSCECGKKYLVTYKLIPIKMEEQ